jgi:predicted ester cyclase
MSIEANKKLVQEFLDVVFQGGNVDAIPQYFRPGAMWAGTVAQTLTTYRNVAPDIEWTIDELIAEGDRVVARLTFDATYTGDGLTHALTGASIQPTGNRIKMGCIWIFKINEGKIAGGDSVIDMHTLYHQMGILPQLVSALAQQ